MLTGAASGSLAFRKRRPRREGHEVFLTALRQHGGHSGVLSVSVILCAPFLMTVHSSVLIEQGEQLGLTGGGLGITRRNDLEEAFILQAIQQTRIPLAPDKQIGGEKARIRNTQME